MAQSKIEMSARPGHFLSNKVYGFHDCFRKGSQSVTLEFRHNGGKIDAAIDDWECWEILQSIPIPLVTRDHMRLAGCCKVLFLSHGPLPPWVVRWCDGLASEELEWDWIEATTFGCGQGIWLATGSTLAEEEKLDILPPTHSYFSLFFVRFQVCFRKVMCLFVGVEAK